MGTCIHIRSEYGSYINKTNVREYIIKGRFKDILVKVASYDDKPILFEIIFYILNEGGYDMGSRVIINFIILEKFTLDCPYSIVTSTAVRVRNRSIDIIHT